MDKFIELRGREAGKTSVILAGVHGNETCGVEAFKKILPKLQIERGRVFFGYGNPEAILKKVRQTESNLNRMFKEHENITATERKSYEYKRARFLKRYLDRADALLDIHASGNPNSRKFIICEKNAFKITKYLPFALLVSGFDKVEPGGTDYYMNRHGKIGICVECGYLRDPATAEVAEKSIMTFLKTRGHIPGKKKVRGQSKINMYSLYLSKTDDFKLSRPFADFEKVSAGEVIGTDGKEKICSPKDGVILFARNAKRAGTESFLLGK
ncbi:MAG TPA: succinylglutamate desuccinylase/aspartoacylase family protein [Candidatus Paceibacterota bacterium]